MGNITIRNELIGILHLIRPFQWYKNLLVFVGATFALKLTEISLYPSLLLGFIALCTASSANYIFNDLVDVGSDKRHPIKKNRPIASGTLSSALAGMVYGFLILLSVTTSWLLSVVFSYIVCFLIILNFLYSTVLKRIVFVDVLVISVGFVLRALAGCYLAEVQVSSWLFVNVFLLALLLALNKRKSELINLDTTASEHRSVQKFYSVDLLNHLTSIVSSSLIVTYALYSFMSETGGGKLLLTFPIAIFIIFRYTYLGKFSGSERAEESLKDVPLLIGILSWAVSVVAILYFGGVE